MPLIIDKTTTNEDVVASFNTDPFYIDGATAIGTMVDVTVLAPAAAVFASATDIDNSANTFTKVSHGLITGLKGQFTTSSALPTGISLATDYFVIVVDSDTVKFASSYANAIAGTAVDITTNGTGNQTFTPTAIAGATMVIQVSANHDSLLDAKWADIASATNITASTTTLLSSGVTATNLLGYRYMRYKFTITAGAMDVKTYTHIHSDYDR